MPTDRRYSLLVLSAVFTANLACFAQSADSVLANGHSVSPLNEAPPLRNAPYTLTRVVTNVQRVADGTTITRKMEIKQAMDSGRRVYSEMRRMNSDGQQMGSVAYALSDPQVRTYLQWNSGSRTAILAREPEPISGQFLNPVSLQAHATETPKHTIQPLVTHEDLGTRTIAGLVARGARTIRVIPIGQESNDAPLTVTSEMWRSTEYGVRVLMVRDDPRWGRRVEELTKFQPGEPDPALFQTPDGYTIKQQVGGSSE